MKALMCITVVVVLLLASTTTLAHPPGFGPGPGWHGGHGYYGYGRGAYFWTNFGLSAGALVTGAMVSYIPPERRVVYVNGSPYFTAGGVYYQPYGVGYVVVAPPVQQTIVVQSPQIVQQPQQVSVVQAQPQAPVAQPNAGVPSSLFFIPNSDGSYQGVPLTRSGSVLIGPQGESYQGIPSVDQLRVRYGK